MTYLLPKLILSDPQLWPKTACRKTVATLCCFKLQCIRNAIFVYFHTQLYLFIKQRLTRRVSVNFRFFLIFLAFDSLDFILELSHYILGSVAALAVQFIAVYIANIS